jgi:hypothetical protein
MRFRTNVTPAQRQQAMGERLRTQAVLIAEQRQQITDLKKIVRHQRRELAAFVPSPAKVLERCKNCGRPTKVVATTISAPFFPCGTCGQVFTPPLMLLQTTVPGGSAGPGMNAFDVEAAAPSPPDGRP